MHADYNIEVAYFILSVAECLRLSNRSCRPWNSKKRTRGLCGPWQTRAEQISCSYGRTSESLRRECLHRDGLRLYARETAVHANPYTPVTILATEDTILRDCAWTVRGPERHVTDAARCSA